MGNQPSAARMKKLMGGNKIERPPILERRRSSSERRFRIGGSANTSRDLLDTESGAMIFTRRRRHCN